MVIWRCKWPFVFIGFQLLQSEVATHNLRPKQRSCALQKYDRTGQAQNSANVLVLVSQELFLEETEIYKSVSDGNLQAKLQNCSSRVIKFCPMLPDEETVPEENNSEQVLMQKKTTTPKHGTIFDDVFCNITLDAQYIFIFFALSEKRLYFIANLHGGRFSGLCGQTDILGIKFIEDVNFVLLHLLKRTDPCLPSFFVPSKLFVCVGN